MSLWDDMPSSLKSGGQLDSLEPVLDSVDTPVETERTEDDGFTWRIWTTTVGGDQPLSVDPATGSFSRSPSSRPTRGSGKTIGVPVLIAALGLRLSGPGCGCPGPACR